MYQWRPHSLLTRECAGSTGARHIRWALSGRSTRRPPAPHRRPSFMSGHPPDSLRPMARVHAYTDDALGKLDAVGLVEAIRARRVSIPEVVAAAIARTERVAGDLNALAVD